MRNKSLTLDPDRLVYRFSFESESFGWGGYNTTKVEFLTRLLRRLSGGESTFFVYADVLKGGTKFIYEVGLECIDGKCILVVDQEEARAHDIKQIGTVAPPNYVEPTPGERAPRFRYIEPRWNWRLCAYDHAAWPVDEAITHFETMLTNQSASGLIIEGGFTLGPDPSEFEDDETNYP